MTQDPNLVLYLLILAENQSVTSTNNRNKIFRHFTILRPDQGLSTVFSVISSVTPLYSGSGSLCTWRTRDSAEHVPRFQHNPMEILSHR